jgi:ribonuclease J
MLFRPAMQSDLVKAQCLSGGLYVYSMWEGYTKRTDYAGTDAWLTQHGLDRRYIHTSGHATPADLRRLAGVLAPKAVVPIHSLAPERLADLLPNVQAHGDGEWWEV